jgi:hypothetical protein
MGRGELGERFGDPVDEQRASPEVASIRHEAATQRGATDHDGHGVPPQPHMRAYRLGSHER